eukprot:s1346_g9.t1
MFELLGTCSCHVVNWDTAAIQMSSGPFLQTQSARSATACHSVPQSATACHSVPQRATACHSGGTWRFGKVGKVPTFETFDLHIAYIAAPSGSSAPVPGMFGECGADEVPKFSVPLNEALDWPGDYPSKLCQHAFGFDLKVSATDFRSQMFHAVEQHLCARPKGIQDHSEWLRTAMTSLTVKQAMAQRPPNHGTAVQNAKGGLKFGDLRSFTVRECQEPAAPYDLKNPQYQFGKREFRAGVEGQWFANEMGSIHQTFTEDEECLLMAIWPGSYVIFSEDQLPDGVFKPVNHSIDREILDHLGRLNCR